MLENELIQGLIIALVSSFLTYVGWLKTKNTTYKDQLTSLTGRVESLEIKHVTEPRVRELIEEDTADLREGMSALNREIRGLTELISNLRIDLGVLNYIKGIQTKHD